MIRGATLRAALADRGLGLEALALVGLLQLGRDCVPFRLRLRLIDSWGRIPSHRRSSVQRVADMVRRACRRVPGGDTCLTRALAARALLRRQGLHSTLHLGVGRTPKGVEAHAWLICGTRVCIGDLEELGSRYQLLASFEAERSR